MRALDLFSGCCRTRRVVEPEQQHLEVSIMLLLVVIVVLFWATLLTPPA